MIGANNPFNIRSSRRNKWQGQIGSLRGFCSFSSLDYGIRAAAYLLMVSYRKQGILQVESIIEKFAPPSENDTRKYSMFVYRTTHVADPHSLIDYCKILQAMSVFEGNPVPFDQIVICCRKFKIEPYEPCTL